MPFSANDLFQEYNQGCRTSLHGTVVNKVDEAKLHSFNVIANTFYEHYNEILNFYNNRASYAIAESFNAKIKAFRTQFRGVGDIKFFMFRLVTLYS